MTAKPCGLPHYKIEMGILHCIENNIFHSHMLLYVYHHAIVLVNPGIQLIGEMRQLGCYFFISHLIKMLPQNMCVGQLVKKNLKSPILFLGLVLSLYKKLSEKLDGQVSKMPNC